MTKEENILYDQETDKLQLERHPIILSETTCILITRLKSTNHLNHIFTTDYIDSRKEQKLAARDLIAQISLDCSINFLKTLKEAIDTELESRNANRFKEGGKEFPLNRPENR